MNETLRSIAALGAALCTSALAQAPSAQDIATALGKAGGIEPASIRSRIAGPRPEAGNVAGSPCEWRLHGELFFLRELPGHEQKINVTFGEFTAYLCWADSKKILANLPDSMAEGHKWIDHLVQLAGKANAQQQDEFAQTLRSLGIDPKDPRAIHKVDRDAAGHEIHTFPLVMTGHGLFIATSAIVREPKSDRLAWIVVSAQPSACRFSPIKESALCNRPREVLAEMAKALLQHGPATP